jgi:hypothetical protein
VLVSPQKTVADVIRKPYRYLDGVWQLFTYDSRPIATHSVDDIGHLSAATSLMLWPMTSRCKFGILFVYFAAKEPEVTSFKTVSVPTDATGFLAETELVVSWR